MTLTNHLLTGAIFAKVLPLPLAIPLAFASHFVLDALPHFGFINIEERTKYNKLFGAIVLLDCLLSVALSAWLISRGHSQWLLAGFAAFSPDLVWIYRFTVEEKFGKLKPTKGNRFIQFHIKIQQYERAWGGLVELVYAVGAFLILR
ncbi:MAG TPA: hypothetical protein VLG16_02965 [Candidatus Saccharimonadales bacterium]|nr:hypothetical protein [Candidatus Saccharimonadales bacterium]